MATRITRRRFLKKTITTAGAAAGMNFIPAPAFLAEASPNSKLGIAVVGCGGAGGGNPGVAANERCVALCDVDERTMGKVVKGIQGKVPNPKVYWDYRKMFDECHKDMDVVLIATPDHHHAPAAIRAIRLGKHAFSQKPLAHNIYECRTLAEAAKKHKVHTQMGNQGHCGEGYRRLCEYLWAGAVGKVLETHSIMGRNFGGTGGRPPSKPVPPYLHWNEWLGPAPWRDYHDGLHTFSWRSWREFGTGTLGDMACHVMDGVFWALKLEQVQTFTIECLSQTGGSEEMYTQNNAIRWEFPSPGDLPPVKVHSYDNEGQKPEVWKQLEKECNKKWDHGTVYVGEKGYLYTGTYGENLQILPEEKHRDFQPPPQSIPRVHGGPIGDLLQACKGGKPPCSNFVDSAGPFTEMVLSGILAMNAGPGKKIEWDVKKMQSTNLPEVNQYVKRTYREGWEV